MTWIYGGLKNLYQHAPWRKYLGMTVLVNKSKAIFQSYPFQAEKLEKLLVKLLPDSRGSHCCGFLVKQWQKQLFEISKQPWQPICWCDFYFNKNPLIEINHRTILLIHCFILLSHFSQVQLWSRDWGVDHQPEAGSNSGIWSSSNLRVKYLQEKHPKEVSWLQEASLHPISET